jgi:RNA polymerase sigma factor (sigma-70 family)
VARATGWVRRLVLTTAIDELRAQAREIPTETVPEEPTSEAVDTCECSLAQMDSLPASYSEVLRRVDLEGRSLADVAATLGVSHGNASVRLHRARRALRERLREHCGVASVRDCLSCGCIERGCCRA